MTHRERIETAWAFREPDRVPIEINLPASWRTLPQARQLVAMTDEHADNFKGTAAPAFGFFGLPATSNTEMIEEKPGDFVRKRQTWSTPAGEFYALTYQPASSPNDFHWEKRPIASLDDLRRLADAPRAPIPFDAQACAADIRAIGESGYPCTYLFHPLGFLVRHATMEEVFAWLYDEPSLVHRFLEVTHEQILATVRSAQQAMGHGLTWVSYAHEMLTPPWMGFDLFDAFVAPYDRRIYAAVHEGGGRFRCHCHGNCGTFLERFADMGMDSTEPLERPPAGDVNLAEAKRLVGRRMLLSGNLPSERFVTLTPNQVRQMVRECMDVAAEGGGFTLRLSGDEPNSGVDLTADELTRVIANAETYIEAGLEYGRYR
jgi:uroporphyrinogen-III decarboxylase